MIGILWTSDPFNIAFSVVFILLTADARKKQWWFAHVGCVTQGMAGRAACVEVIKGTREIDGLSA